MNELDARASLTGNSARVIAFRSIRDKIILLEKKPGEALSDKQLAEELGMSRTPVREAILILSTANMVVLRPQVGTFVAPIDPEWVEMEQFFRLAGEKEILRLACGKIGPELRRCYEENLRDFAEAIASDEQGRLSRVLALDNTFHSLAFRAAGHSHTFLHYQRREMQHLERLRALSLLVEDGSRLLEDHRRITAALFAGDEAAALSELEAHLSRYRESLSRLRERFPEYFTIG